MTLGLAILVIALGFGLTWLVFHLRAQRIIERRSRQLEVATGVPAKQIRDEMRAYGLTPGQWAFANGLDPITFRPR